MVFFFFLRKKKHDCFLGLKYRIFYNRLLVWIEFKFVEV